jgi:hypothetical protein
MYRTVILPVVLCGCEAWSLTLTEEHRLRMFENRVLKKIFGPNREEVTGEWGKLHNEELCHLYSSPNMMLVSNSRRMRWTGHMARMGERRGAYRVLMGRPVGRRPLERPRNRGEAILKWIFKKQNERTWTRSNWFRIGTRGESFLTW